MCGIVGYIGYDNAKELLQNYVKLLIVAILMDLLESVTHVGQHTVYRIMKTLIHINHQMAVLL